jgi:hypothetical protein
MWIIIGVTATAAAKIAITLCRTNYGPLPVSQCRFQTLAVVRLFLVAIQYTLESVLKRQLGPPLHSPFAPLPHHRHPAVLLKSTLHYARI